MKVCIVCKEAKQETEYSKDRSRKDGLHVLCKPCDRARTKAFAMAHPDKIKAYSHDVDRFRKHGITQAQYLGLLALQGGVCGACGAEPSKALGLQVDHSHNCCPGKWSCGKCIRGLLCTSCNNRLGYVERAKSPSNLGYVRYMLRAPLRQLSLLAVRQGSFAGTSKGAVG